MKTAHKIPSILEDDREIKRIVWPDDSSLTVGKSCEKIIAYEEKRWGTWLAIYKAGEIQIRLSAARLIIMYELPADEEA